MRKGLFLAVLLALVCVAVPVSAQSAFAPTATGETGLFTLFSGQNAPAGGWTFGLYYNNWDRIIPFPDPIGDSATDRHRVSASVGYAFSDNFEVAVMLPYEKLDGDGNNLDAEGFSNARLGAKWSLFNNLETGSAFAITAGVEAPTGDDEVAGEDWGYTAGIAYSHRNFVFNINYRDQGDDGDLNLAETVTGGFGYAAPINENFDWITELVGTFYTGDGFEFDESYDFTTGGRVWMQPDHRWAFNFALRTDLAQVSDFDENCPLGGLIGLTFFPTLAMAEVAPTPPAPEPAPAPPPAAPEPAPAPAPAPPPPPAPAPEVRETVNFDSGSARLSNIAKAKLDEVALKMKQDPALRAMVIGFSDNAGAESGNQKLSQQRADAVKNYLVTRHGIDAARITVEGRGSAEAVGSNDTAEGRAENRRAVVILKIE